LEREKIQRHVCEEYGSQLHVGPLGILICSESATTSVQGQQRPKMKTQLVPISELLHFEELVR
jgi:hypothetical protein